MEVDDIFGGKISDLFDEFEKDRVSTGSFITYDKNDDGEEVKSKIFFHVGESDSSSDSDSDEEVPCENENGLSSKQPSIDDDEHCLSSEYGKSTINGLAQKEDEPVDSDDGSNTQPCQSGKRANVTNFKLIHERNKYCRYSRLIDSTRLAQDKSPGIQILFQNNSFSRKYRAQIEQYISWLLQQEAQEDRGERLPNLPLKASCLTCLDLNSNLPPEKRNDRMSKEHAIIGCAQFHRDYLVDSLGWPLVDNNPALTDGWEVPQFLQAFMDPLPVTEADTPAKKPERAKASCFNCSGDHILGECTQPRDHKKINENRAVFTAQQNASPSVFKGPRSARYHKELDTGKKFKPGSISDELREALGMSKDQLPLYIYRMRIMGYPPGWLQEAQGEESSLELFDKDGKAVKAETEEEGEITDGTQPPPQLDVDKIIEYPGFTVPAPPGAVDEWQELRMVPMQEHQMKTTLKQQTVLKEATKRKREDYDGEIARKRARVETDMLPEMEIDNDEPNRSPVKSLFIPPLPVDTPPSKPPLPDSTPPPTPPVLDGIKYHPTMGNMTPSPNSTPRRSSSTDSRKRDLIRQVSDAGSASSGRRGSPSLEDLEEQYQLLQQKLAESETGSTQLVVLDSCSDDDAADVVQGMKPKLTRHESTTSIQSFGELGRGNSLPNTPVVQPSAPSFTAVNSSFKSSLSVSKEFGTPIACRSGFDNVPDSDNFQGICDHIPFENLPDSTGTFEKMRSLLQKIREKIPRRTKKL